MLLFLQAVGEAVAAKGVRGLMGLAPFGDRLYDIAADAIARYRRLNREKQLAADLQEVVQAELSEVRSEAKRIAESVAAGHSSEEIIQLEAYLTLVPGVARHTLRRAQDPTGTTVPLTLELANPVHLASVLPRRAPLFRIGDPVPDAPQWILEQPLGAGGFGEVWLGRHQFLPQLRAFKFCIDPLARERLLRHEGEVVKRVREASGAVSDKQHGIVPLLDAYLNGDTPWLAYEYIEGGDLAGMVRNDLQKLPPPRRAARAILIVGVLAKVVGRLHALPHPIIHRDLKPANVLLKRVADRWMFRVTDFGISHVVSDHGQAPGTVSTPSVRLSETFRGAHSPVYASPQQKQGRDPDPRDDVYALGVIGYQLLLADLTVERPGGKWRKRVADCQLSEAVLDLLESCWDDDPEERPRTAQVLADRLKGLERATADETATNTFAAPTAEPVRAVPTPIAAIDVETGAMTADYRTAPPAVPRIDWIAPAVVVLPPDLSEPVPRPVPDGGERNREDESERPRRVARKRFNRGKYCYECGEWIRLRTVVCPDCGVRQRDPDAQPVRDRDRSLDRDRDSDREDEGRYEQYRGKRITAGILALLLGTLGIHKFVLGYPLVGLTVLLVSLLGAFCTAGIAPLVLCVIGFVEGILYLTKSDRDFYREYIARARPWF